MHISHLWIYGWSSSWVYSCRVRWWWTWFMVSVQRIWWIIKIHTRRPIPLSRDNRWFITWLQKGVKTRMKFNYLWIYNWSISWVKIHALWLWIEWALWMIWIRWVWLTIWWPLPWDSSWMVNGRLMNWHIAGTCISHLWIDNWSISWVEICCLLLWIRLIRLIRRVCSKRIEWLWTSIWARLPKPLLLKIIIIFFLI